MKRIRILYLCHDARPYGAQKSLQLMMDNLPRDRYEVFVTFEREGELLDTYQDRPDVTVLRSKRIHVMRHRVRRGWARVGDAVGLFFSMGRATQLARLCRQHKIDVVHSNTLVSLTGAMAAKLVGIPHVWHIREWFEEDNPHAQLIFGKNMTKRLVHQFSDRVLCVSKLVQHQFSPYFETQPDKYTVLYNVIEMPQNKIPKNGITQPGKNPSDPFVLVYLGRVSDGKRFHDIIDALRVLRRDFSEDAFPFRLQVYGTFNKPEFEESIRNTLEDAQLSEFVKFLGYENDLAKCFEQADLLVHPSVNESFGRTVIEAMSYGVPVLAAESGGPTEIIEEGHTGYFYRPKDPDHLAKKLKERYISRDEYPQIRAKISQYVEEKFVLSQQIHQLDDLYRALIN